MKTELTKDYQIKLIKSISEFELLKETWNQIYSEDPYAHIFISWDWLNTLFSVTEIDWFVLAVEEKETSRFVAFLQFSQTENQIKNITISRQLRLGAFPFGNSSGILCKNGFENIVAKLVTRYLRKKISWDYFLIANAIDPRVGGVCAGGG